MPALAPHALPVASKVRGSPFYLTAGCVVLGAALRLLATRTDFWLDEIWSWKIATRVIHSPLQALTRPEAQSDNNHPLNTVFMYLIGPDAPFPVYRLLAVISGIGAIVLAARIMGRHSRVSGVVAAMLLAFSYPLIVYSSEARGYAPMVFFALLAFDTMDRYLQRPRLPLAALFGVACVLGLLAHLTFLQCYLSLAIYSVFTLRRYRRPARQIAVDVLRLHAIPLLSIMALYLIFMRHLTIGGGNTVPLSTTIASVLSLLIGGPEGAKSTALIAASAIAAVLGLFARRRSEWFIFFLIAVIGAPVLFVVLQLYFLGANETIFPRYFLAPFTFALLLLSVGLAELLKNPGWLRGAGAAVLSAMLIGNAYSIGRFLIDGRGHYSQAVRYMAEQSPGPVITITTDTENEFRTRMLLEFYARSLPPGKRFGFNQPMSGAIAAPQWIIINTQESNPWMPEIRATESIVYSFDRQFPYFGLSGWSWQLYRLQSQP